MAFIHGKSSVFKMDTNSGALTDLSSYIEEVSLSRPVDTAEVTTLGDSDKAYIVGLRDGTVSVSGPWDATLDAQLHNALGTTNTLTFNYSPDAGTTTYSGELICTSYEVSSPVGDKISWSAEFQVTAGVGRPT